jgi:hypothetical protein
MSGVEKKVKLKVERKGKTVFEKEGYLLYDSKLRKEIRGEVKCLEN